MSRVTRAAALAAMALLALSLNAQFIPPEVVLLPAGKPLPDPFPIQRLDRELPATAGPLVALPQSEFEARVQAAARTEAAAPRVLTAKFAAALVGSDLVGTAEWHLAASAPALLPLEPFNLALANPVWADGSPALLDRTTTTRLWIAKPGESTWKFDWSARGREEPGALRFELRQPVLPIAAMEVDLPVGRTLAAGDALVAGPLPSSKADSSLWRIAFGGKSRLELVVRNLAGSVPDSVRASRSARYDLAAGQATFDFDLEALRGPASAWAFRVDADVRVLDVLTPQHDPWLYDAARREVIVSPREPQSAGRVSILATTPMPFSSAPWACPGIHGAGPSGEDAIEFRVGSDVKLERWEPGDYTLVRTAATADRGYALNFRGSWRTGETTRKPPLLSLKAATPEVSANATLDWKLGTSTNRLAALYRLTVLHGPVAQFPLRLPVGYSPGRVHLVPDDPAATMTSNGSNWLLEPSQPWNTGQIVDLRFELRGPPMNFSGHRTTIAVPRLAPLSPMTIDGMLTIEADDGLHFAPLPGFQRIDGRTLRRPLNPRDGDTSVTVERDAMPRTPAAAVKSPLAPAWQFEYLTLRAHVDDAGNITAALRGVARFAADRWLPIELPPGAIVESASVAGKWADPAVDPASEFIRLPWPLSENTSFELHYRLAAPVTGIASRCPAVAAKLPGEPTVSVVWSCAAPYRFWPSLGHWSAAESSVIVCRGAVFVVLVLMGLLLGAVLLFIQRRLRRAFFGIAVLGILAIATTAILADEPEAATVYLRRDASGITVFAPKELLDQLEKIAVGDRPAVAFLDATIRGRELETQAAFDISFRVIISNDREQTVTLPVHGLALETATLDGESAFPAALPGQRYSLAVNGRGAHTIAVSGRVPIVIRGADREVMLPLDPLPSARLTFTADPTARGLNVPTRQGSRRADRAAIDAELGSSGTAVIRWRSGGTANNPARASASGMTLWDIANGEATVTAAFVLHVEDGSLTRLAFDLPANLEPGRATIRTVAGSPLALRDWRLTPGENGRRTFTVILQEPLEGASTVTLRLAPLMPLTANPALTTVKLATATTVSPSYLAVRTSAAVERWEKVGFQNALPDAIPRELASLSELGLDRAPTPTLFRRDGAADAWVRPVLHVAALPRPATDEIVWQFSAKATVDGFARFGKDVSASAVEFDVPSAVTLSEVQSVDVAGWSKQGSRATVWFRSPQRDVSVKWSGTWSAYPKLPAAFDLPQSSRSSPWRILRLHAAPGYDLTLMPNRWLPVMSLRPRETALLAPAVASPLRLQVEARPGP